MDYYLFYIKQGLSHITDLSAYDHILFIMSFACIYSFKDIKKIIFLVTAFTAGHSIALALSTFEIIKISALTSEFLIPITIIISSVMNLQKLIGIEKAKKVSTKNMFHVEHNIKNEFIIITFFGLIHGLGFSNYLRFILSNNESIFSSLLSFNIGLEIGQIIIVLIVLLINFVLLWANKKLVKYWNIIILLIIIVVSFKLVLNNSHGIFSILKMK